MPGSAAALPDAPCSTGAFVFGAGCRPSRSGVPFGAVSGDAGPSGSGRTAALFTGGAFGGMVPSPLPVGSPAVKPASVASPCSRGPFFLLGVFFFF